MRDTKIWGYIARLFIRNTILFKKQKDRIGDAGDPNPVPLACKASALPFELHPHML